MDKSITVGTVTRSSLLFAMLVLVMLTLAACDGAEQGDQPQQDNGGQEAANGQDDAPQAEDGQEADSASGNDDQDSAEADGTTSEVYEVGPAGEVEISVEGDSLTLVEARPNEGWSIDEIEEEDDEIEVDFVRGNEEWEFEAELENGQVEIEIDSDTDD